jgi:hypothetical protein
LRFNDLKGNLRTSVRTINRPLKWESGPKIRPKREHRGQAKRSPIALKLPNPMNQKRRDRRLKRKILLRI